MMHLRLCLVVSVILIARSVAAAADVRPNILLIIADDLGYSDIGAYGGEILTPNLDRLAAEGMRFTQFYNCGTGVMTRAALYTGRHPRQGPRVSMNALLRENMVTVVELMREAGYATTLTGKWQLGTMAPNRPTDRGFSEFYGGLDGMSHHFNPAQRDPKFHGGRARPFVHNEQSITAFPEDFYSTDAFSNHAVETIRKAANAQQPFFLNVCYTAPHYPLHAPEEDIARYRGKYQDGYEPLRERRFKRLIELGLFEARAATLSPASLDHLYEYEFTPWKRLDPVSRARQEARMEAYAAMVDRLDQGVGRILTALEQTGAARNTVIFFFSDNGGCAHFPIRKDVITPQLEHEPIIALNRDIPVGDRRGFEFVGAGWGWAQNAPFRRHKGWTYEGGICSPLIVRWPGAAAPGVITHVPGHVVDLMPTLLELAGGTYPRESGRNAVSEMEGRSLVPVLRGRSMEARPVPLGWELHGSRALRDGPWKLLWDAGEKRWELYDLATDRAETVDLAGQHPERVEAMAATWKKWAQQTEAPTR
jgi:arylsulfatase